MPIRRLPESLVNQIAAGEVVERPAAALKELVENSLDAGATRIVLRARVPPEGGVVIEVEDDGSGMSPEVLEQALEPFFTTRREGRGLGLFFVHSVAAGLGGTFELTSTQGVGTLARLWLPGRPA